MVIDNELDFKSFIELIDNVFDEIFIWDSEMRVIYVNKACYRHYGLREDAFIGKKLSDFTISEKMWTPTCVPDTFSEKKPVIQKQKTFLGMDIVTISVPIFDDENNVKYVVQSVRDDNEFLFKELSPIKTPEKEIDNAFETEMIYKSSQMKDLVQYAKKIAATKAPILILGETGTGKTYIAKYIHEHSERKDEPFISINMASLNPSVIESEFFGYKQGAFTGANKGGKKGIFEMANGGTLFLDEIGEFPYELQAKFLHVIQEEEFIPVGGVNPVKLDIRIICATNCDLKKLIDVGKFRRDLYHRINMFELTIPPLRKRKEDISVLASHFLNMFNEKYNKSVTISEEVFDIFMKYLWAGNVRELSNVIERGVITAENDEFITVKNLPESFFTMDNIKVTEDCIFETKNYNEVMEEYERKIILNAYKKYPSSRKMAEAIGVSQTTASRLIRKYTSEEE